MRLRAFRRVEIVLSETVFHFQATDALAHVTFLWRHGASSPASFNLAKTKELEGVLFVEQCVPLATTAKVVRTTGFYSLLFVVQGLRFGIESGTDYWEGLLFVEHGRLRLIRH